MLVEVWHRERLRSDLLLGVASTPLTALLQDPWIDGWAAIYALMVQARTRVIYCAAPYFLYTAHHPAGRRERRDSNRKEAP